MDAEYSNPQMYKQMMTQFVTTFKACDVNKDGVLKRDEFLNFMEQNNENRKKMFGESVLGDDHENNQWYDAYNLMSPTTEGVSMEDFGSSNIIQTIGFIFIHSVMFPLRYSSSYPNIRASSSSVFFWSSESRVSRTERVAWVSLCRV